MGNDFVDDRDQSHCSEGCKRRGDIPLSTATSQINWWSLKIERNIPETK